MRTIEGVLRTTQYALASPLGTTSLAKVIGGQAQDPHRRKETVETGRVKMGLEV